MKALRAIGLAVILAVFMSGPALAAQATVGLGSAASYAILAGQTITNTGSTTIYGDVGLHPGTSVTGFASVTLHGAQHITDAAALAAEAALGTAYDDAAGRSASTIPTQLGGTTQIPGAYNSEAGTFQVTGTLTLNGQGNYSSVFIFQTTSTLITASSSSVRYTNGAQPCHVFWKVGSSATLGTSTSFIGTILALTDVHLQTGATLQGRALARNGEVTLDTNVITRAACSSGTPPPSSTSAPQTPGGSSSTTALMLLFASLAAGAAFVTIRQRTEIRR